MIPHLGPVNSQPHAMLLKFWPAPYSTCPILNKVRNPVLTVKETRGQALHLTGDCGKACPAVSAGSRGELLLLRGMQAVAGVRAGSATCD